MPINQETDLNKFLKNIAESWVELRNSNSKAANAKTRSNDKLVKKWVEAGINVDLLLPLIDHDSNAVKLSAASYLLPTAEIKIAISILRNLDKYDRSGVGLMAGAVLRLNKIPKEPEATETPVTH